MEDKANCSTDGRPPICLVKPSFWSTRVDCFGPFQVKLGCQVEKQWGIIFKYLTTRCRHLGLLESMGVEAFLMAL